MADHREKGNSAQVLAQHDQSNGLSDLARVNTTITLSPEQFEKLYLAPIGRGQPQLAKRFANPTPL